MVFSCSRRRGSECGSVVVGGVVVVGVGGGGVGGGGVGGGGVGYDKFPQVGYDVYYDFKF